MKKVISASLLVLMLAAGSLANGAETKPAAAPAPAEAPTSPAATGLAGHFWGKWQGQDESGGQLTLKFTPGKEAWSFEAVFTFEGNPVPTTAKSITVDGGKVELVFAWEIQGTASTSKLTGELKGNDLAGTYESTAQEGAAKGKWNVSRVAKGY